VPPSALRDRLHIAYRRRGPTCVRTFAQPLANLGLAGLGQSEPALASPTASWSTARSISKTSMSPVTRAELDAVINAFARTLARYVPDEKLDEAEAFMRGELGLVGGGRDYGEAS